MERPPGGGAGLCPRQRPGLPWNLLFPEPRGSIHTTGPRPHLSFWLSLFLPGPCCLFSEDIPNPAETGPLPPSHLSPPRPCDIRVGTGVGTGAGAKGVHLADLFQKHLLLEELDKRPRQWLFHVLQRHCCRRRWGRQIKTAIPISLTGKLRHKGLTRPPGSMAQRFSVDL